MGFPRGTTPTFTLTFTDENLDLTQASHVYVTFESPLGQAITKTGEYLTVGEKSIVVALTQTESLTFAEGSVDIQANWTMADGNRCGSEVASCNVDRQLMPKVVK